MKVNRLSYGSLVVWRERQAFGAAVVAILSLAVDIRVHPWPLHGLCPLPLDKLVKLHVVRRVSSAGPTYNMGGRVVLVWRHVSCGAVNSRSTMPLLFLLVR